MFFPFTYDGGCRVLCLTVSRRRGYSGVLCFFQKSKGLRVLELGGQHYSLNPETLPFIFIYLFIKNYWDDVD